MCALTFIDNITVKYKFCISPKAKAATNVEKSIKLYKTWVFIKVREFRFERHFGKKTYDKDTFDQRQDIDEQLP